MIRGTTPTHTFTLPVDCSEFKRIRILYAQNDETLIKRDLETLECDGNTVSCTLTQAETLLLDCDKPCDIQVRALTLRGEALACKPRRIDIGRCLDNEVLE